MPDAPSKIRWDAENVRIFTVKFMRKTDEDVIEFLEPRNKRNTLLKAIRYYMENHPDELKGEVKDVGSKSDLCGRNEC